MFDLDDLTRDAIARGSLIVPFGEPLKTGGVYALRMRDGRVAHPEGKAVLTWLESQTEQRDCDFV